MERRAAISAAGTRFTMKFRVRYLLIMLIFLVGAVVNIDRSNISIAGSFLAADYHISRIQLGWVFSAFMIGYAAFLIPAGWIAGRLGPRRTLTGGLVWWGALTTATALVPPAMANALWALIAARFILGLGEALAYPSANQFIAAWFPSQERGKANALVQGGAQLGSGIAPPLIAFIIYKFGWHAAFYVSAVIGLVIAVFWYSAARDVPAQHPSVTPQEMAHIEAGLPVRMEGPMPPVPWAKVFSSKDVWSTALAYAGFGYNATIFSTWFFIYLKDGRGFDLKSSALLGMLPFIATTSCCLTGGVISDWLVKRWNPYIGRSLFGACTLLLSGVILMAGGHAQNGVAAALLLSGAVGALYLGQAVYYAVAADLGGPHTGVVSGLVSMCGQIAGAATASLTPFFASRYGWDQAFTIAAGVTFVCIIPWLFVNPKHRVYALQDEPGG
jgi:ACS family glucarate transporter-like MFS transporter